MALVDGDLIFTSTTALLQCREVQIWELDRALDQAEPFASLGIDAPRSVTVYREEVYRRVMSENEVAVRESSPDNSTMAKPHENLGGVQDTLKDDKKKSPDS